MNSARAATVRLSVSFRLTDLDYKPIAGAPVRLVVGTPDGWQGAQAGERGVTDANGSCQVDCVVRLEERRRKRPTNFWSSLVQRPEATDYLEAAVELDYAGHRWLYVVGVHRFQADGDALLEHFSVYNRDAAGNFTRKAEVVGSDWKMPDLEGRVLTGAGHEPWNFKFEPDPTDSSGSRWMMELAFKRAPDPVWR